MGWIYDSAPEHEGYLVGLVRATNRDGSLSDWRYRELWSDTPQYAGHQGRIPVATVQAGCDCGWRSPRLDASCGATWYDGWVDVSETCENRARALWREHVTLDIARRGGELHRDDIGLQRAAEETIATLDTLRPQRTYSCDVFDGLAAMKR